MVYGYADVQDAVNADQRTKFLGAIGTLRGTKGDMITVGDAEDMWQEEMMESLEDQGYRYGEGHVEEDPKNIG